MIGWVRLLTSRSSFSMLVIIAIASVIANTGWRVVMNNFAVDTVGMTGADVGLLQSVREIPGLLSFTVLFLLLIISEQQVAVLCRRAGIRRCHNGLLTLNLWLLFQHNPDVCWFSLSRSSK